MGPLVLWTPPFLGRPLSSLTYPHLPQLPVQSLHLRPVDPVQADRIRCCWRDSSCYCQQRAPAAASVPGSSLTQRAITDASFLLLLRFVWSDQKIKSFYQQRLNLCSCRWPQSRSRQCGSGSWLRPDLPPNSTFSSGAPCSHWPLL